MGKRQICQEKTGMITHTLICGVTMSGKTTLARHIAQSLDKKDQAVVVYDPLGTPTENTGWGEKARIFASKDDFLEFLSSTECGKCHIFIDEAADIFSQSDSENFWLATRGRHYGYQLYLIAQRPKMIAPTVRTQCGLCYMFRLSKDDAKEICADFGHNYPEVLENGEKEIKPLDKGDALVLTSGSASFERFNIFNYLKRKKS